MDKLNSKTIIINMRPHHFLCLPGYKGYSYNKEHTNNWDNISLMILQNPNLKVKIVEGNDSLCLKCPNIASNLNKCNVSLIEELDKTVENLLGLVTGQVYSYNKLLDNLKEILDPHKHAELCKGCHWRNSGLCKDTFSKDAKPILKQINMR